MNDFITKMWAAVGSVDEEMPAINFTGQGTLDSVYNVNEFACAAIGTAAAAIAELIGSESATPEIVIDRRLAAFWFAWSLRPIGWTLPSAWDPIAGDYASTDGWIRLHTNAPHHRQAAEKILGASGDRNAIAKAVAKWAKEDLERAVIEAGGCAAEMRTCTEWKNHPQGIAVAAEPLVHINELNRSASTTNTFRSPKRSRPLNGIRVLDLTRVLAGPIATRFLAGFGADVLRIDPPGWDEPGVVPEVTVGKRCAVLDLRDTEARGRFETLLSNADVLIHGYRPGALEALGYGAGQRRAIAPQLIDVCLSAYGWTGPWAERRGFDSLVQMSTGIADAGLHWRDADKPIPLPVQALDHASGYLMAAAAIRAITNRQKTGVLTEAKLSLAKTAELLIASMEIKAPRPQQFLEESPEDISAVIERTFWGQAQRLKPPLIVQGCPWEWSCPAGRLGDAEPKW